MGGAAVIGGTAVSGEKTELLTTFGGSNPDEDTVVRHYDDQADPTPRHLIFGTSTTRRSCRGS